MAQQQQVTPRGARATINTHRPQFEGHQSQVNALAASNMMKEIAMPHPKAASSSASSAASPNKDNASPAAGSVAYTLFLYREQLRRRNVRLLALSKTKLELTQELVSCSVDRIAEYDVDELMNLNREIQFTRKLKSRMHQIKRMQKLYAMQRNLMSKI